MRILLAGLLSLVLGGGDIQAGEAQLCVIDPAKMPESWRAPEHFVKALNTDPWSAEEAANAKYSIDVGVKEMADYFRNKPSSIHSLGADAVEALVQVTYSSANSPEFDKKVKDAARWNLDALNEPYLKREIGSLKCDDFEKLLPLSIFSHRLYPKDDPRTDKITDRTNAAFRQCPSLNKAVEFDIEKRLSKKKLTPKQLFEVYIWALWFVEAEIFPKIELPVETRKFAPKLWEFMKNYPIADVDDFKDGIDDEGFVAMADLVPHMAHLVTGTHRFPLYVNDSPRIYKFHRENFYAALELGELDLFASFVDTLRQYGCTAENDIQVRDGSRFLLHIFRQGNDSWMAYRQPGETDANIDDYGLIHYPWTSILGVRVRNLEQAAPGNIGGVLESWMQRDKN